MKRYVKIKPLPEFLKKTKFKRELISASEKNSAFGEEIRAHIGKELGSLFHAKHYPLAFHCNQSTNETIKLVVYV